MSMLAERRTKKKWCLNPNGKEWSNDDSKFGQRMLEKMGWKKGCGLGVNLQGIKEHVKVSAKNDTKGLGCKNNSDNEWIHHQQNFENLLSELASSTYEEIRPLPTSETKVVSLEEKSKNSRVRVHYQKFTRGKDVSRYSAKDLACIFGKKCNSLDSKSFGMQNSSHLNTRNISDSEADTISGEHNDERSLNLYEEKTTDDSLSSLLPKHNGKGKPILNSHEVKGVPETQNDIFKEISNMEENSVTESLEKIRSKKKRKRVKHSENNQEVVTVTMSSPQDEVSDCDTVVKEKHKVILKEISDAEDNCVTAVDLVEECKSDMLDNSASNSLAEPLEKVKSKKKRKRVKELENNQDVVTVTIASSSQDQANDCDIVVQKKQNGILKENSVAVVDLVEECETEMLNYSASQSVAHSLEKIRNKRKRKHVKDSENNQEVIRETIVSSSHDEVIDCDAVVHEVEEKKKKKKKKKDKVKVDDGTGKEDNKIFIEEVIEVISDAEETGNKDLENACLINEADSGGTKIKKKKTDKLYQSNISEVQEECPEMKKRKKKKMRAQSLNELYAAGDITSEIVSPLPPDKKTRVNNMQESRNFTSEPFSSYKIESHQYDNNNAVKHRKTAKKHHRESTELGFIGSNLHSIPGYGNL